MSAGDEIDRFLAWMQTNVSTPLLYRLSASGPAMNQTAWEQEVNLPRHKWTRETVLGLLGPPEEASGSHQEGVKT